MTRLRRSKGSPPAAMRDRRVPGVERTSEPRIGRSLRRHERMFTRVVRQEVKRGAGPTIPCACPWRNRFPIPADPAPHLHRRARARFLAAPCPCRAPLSYAFTIRRPSGAVGQSPLPGGLCVRTPLLSALVIAVLAAAGCATESAEERTSDDVAREFVEGLDESLIWFNIRAETPESLHELGGPCDSSSDDYAVLENVLALLRNVGLRGQGS